MRWLLILSLLSAGCAQKRIAALESRVGAVEAELAAMRRAPAPQADAARDAAATALYQEASAAAQAWRWEEARSSLDRLASEYAGTSADQRAKSLRTELSVVGKPAGALEVDRWLQGHAGFDGPGVKLVVFAEEWCPHCRREVPKLEGIARAHQGSLQVIGLTKLTRGSTEEKMRAFIADNAVTFPFAIETGSMTERFGVSGIPAAVLIKDGTVIWRGHPARLTDEQLERAKAL